jgi:hypothetical protein
MKMTMSEKLRRELALCECAARDPNLKVAIEEYDRLRQLGVGHKDSLILAAELAEINEQLASNRSA